MSSNNNFIMEFETNHNEIEEEEIEFASYLYKNLNSFLKNILDYENLIIEKNKKFNNNQFLLVTSKKNELIEKTRIFTNNIRMKRYIWFYGKIHDLMVIIHVTCDRIEFFNNDNNYLFDSLPNELIYNIFKYCDDDNLMKFGYLNTNMLNLIINFKESKIKKFLNENNDTDNVYYEKYLMNKCKIFDKRYYNLLFNNNYRSIHLYHPCTYAKNLLDFI